ncbi:hypothetical protein KSP40_PGU008262 [Platanthera guangdongensis]|uniref:Uncharacterized protein n=1 Tax=Platanthera guangdongensis TaxID=2320717 RepID=A0ABR2N2I1_9ASPA
MISNMVEKVPSFRGGGAYWFIYLTTPDTMYILPGEQICDKMTDDAPAIVDTSQQIPMGNAEIEGEIPIELYAQENEYAIENLEDGKACEAEVSAIADQGRRIGKLWPHGLL